MLKPAKLLFLVAVGVAAWYFFTHFQIRGLDQIRVETRGTDDNTSSAPPPDRSGRKTFRIASANLYPLDLNKLTTPGTAARITRMLQEFELIAVQGIVARDRSIVDRLVALLNAEGRRYDFAVAPQVGRAAGEEYVAFLFDTDAIQIDRSTLATVEDSAGRFRHPPLVAAFRARGPAERDAFTFTLINVWTPPDRVPAETNALADVFRAVRNSGRNEDDIILLGDLAADDQHLEGLAKVGNLTAVITGTATTMRTNRLADNIVFDRYGTVEYAHRAGVLDMMRMFDILAREAETVSEHLPIWAEFSVYEGGTPGSAAAPAP